MLRRIAVVSLAAILVAPATALGQTRRRTQSRPRPAPQSTQRVSAARTAGANKVAEPRGKSGFDPLFGQRMGSDTVTQAFRDAIADDSVQAILFRVDSPGGSYVASDSIWREVRRARDAGKPVIVSMGNVAEVALIFAQTEPDSGPKGLACFLVPTSSEGFSAQEIHGKLGLRASDTAALAPLVRVAAELAGDVSLDASSSPSGPVG